MRPLLERLGGFLPAAIALALPTVFIANAVDSYILPRAAIVIAGAGLGLGLTLLLPPGPGLGSLRIPLIAATAAALLAFVFSVSWPLSFIGSYTRYESLPIRLSYLGLLTAPVWLLRDPRSRDMVIPAFVVGTVIASIQALGQELLLYDHLIAYRPDGNLGNANLLGALLAMAFPLALARALRGGRFVAAWWIGVVVMAGAVVASSSRSGALGALAGCLALGVLRLKGRRALAGAAAAIAVIAVALLAILFSPLRLLNGDPGPARLHLWPDAIRMIAARPVTGWGEDATGLVYGRFLTGDWSPEVDRAHSGPLDIAATQGLLGLVALGWVLLTLARGVWRWRLTGSVGALAAACIGYTVWVIFNFDWAPATGAFWLLAGTAWSSVRAAEAEAGSGAAGGAPVPQMRTLRSAGAVVAAIAVVWLSVLPVLADTWFYHSRLDLAVAADPLQARYHWALGEGLLAIGSVSRGLNELQLAARLGESDPQLYVDIGDAEQGIARSAEARAAYKMALTIDPFYAPARQRLAAMGVPFSGSG
jgi:O-antigen ligase